MFLGAFVVMGLLHESLQGPAGFASALELMDNALVAFCLWGFVSVLGYHFIAGIKHLMMDLGHFETLESAPGAAKFTLASGVVVVVLSGIWVW
jgi:succinate dehydrogenase / fumarate reductase, cytochrome b subunit